LQLEEKQELASERRQVKPKSSDESMMIHETAVEKEMVEKSTAEEIPVDELSSTEADGIVTPPLPSPSYHPPLPPRPVATTAALESHDAGQRRNSLMQLGAQQDVSECLDNVMFQVEVALTAAEQKFQQATGKCTTPSAELDDGWIEDGDQLRRLFLGRTLQRLELASSSNEGDRSVVRGPSIHMKREVFTILPIDVVEEERDIYDGLDGFFDEEILTGSGGEPIRRTVTLTDAPAIMQIQLQRVQYDRVKGVYKSQAHLEVGQALYMDRYLDFDPLDAADAVRLEKRRKGREARKRVAELRERLRALEPQKTPISQTLKQTSSFLSSLASVKGKSKASKETSEEGEDQLDTLLDSDFSQFLGEEADRVEKESKEALKEIAALKASVEELWKDEKRMEYVLTSVFMHRGEASHGHYFLNQRKLTPQDQEPSSTWFKYNDQTVMQVNWSDVHRDQSGATPYLLCWVRKDKLDHFDTLCRSYDVAPLSTTQPGVAEEKLETVIPPPPPLPPTILHEPVVPEAVPQNDDTIMTDVAPH
jgi:ubiquitin carboxyl-terminal hydrolase 25/28